MASDKDKEIEEYRRKRLEKIGMEPSVQYSVVATENDLHYEK